MPDLLQAEHFQSPDDPAVKLAVRRTGGIARSMKAGLKTMAEALDRAGLRQMVQAGDRLGIESTINSHAVSDALLEAYKPVVDTFTEAAEVETKEKLGALTVYDPLYAAGQLAGAQQNFIGAVQGDAAKVVQEQLLQALRQGADPDEIALGLKQVIGLNPQRAKAVLNFRRLLEEGDSQALRRVLRDQRFDRTVRSWIDGTAKVDPAKVDDMVAAYADRQLQSRALTIAQNESLKATTGGIRDAYVQAVGGGRLPEAAVKRFWQINSGERTCPICASIPLLNLQGVGVFQPYLSAAGPVMAPLVHVNCACSEKYVTDLSSVTVNPFTGRPSPGVRVPQQLPTIHL